MKLLLAIIVSVATMQPVDAQDIAIMQKRVSISAQDAEITNVLDDISRKSGVNFSYNSDLLKNHKVSLNRQDCELQHVLDAILSESLTYSVIGGNIVIFEKKDQPEEQKMINISGVVRDAAQKNTLPFASVSINNSALGTISNENGRFELSVSQDFESDTLIISYLGYEAKKIPLSQLSNGTNHDINLSQYTYGLGEVLVTPVETEKIVRESITRIRSQYFNKSNVYKAFYRESYYSDSAFISRDEAVLNIYNSGNSDFTKNKMSILEGRKIVSKNQYDVLLKLRGGPFNIMDLDFANRHKEFLSNFATKYYDFTYAGKDSTDGYVYLVINFEKKNPQSGICYSGRIFVERQSKSIAKMEFEIAPDGKQLKAKNRKGETVDMQFRRMAYRVNYTRIDDKWYLQSCIGEETRQITDPHGKNTFITTIQQLIITESSGSRIFPKTGTTITRNDVISDAIMKHNANAKKKEEK